MAKKSMSSYAFRQEFMASFEARGSEMFKEGWVQFGEEPEVGDYYIAVDLAGFDNIIHGRWSLDETATKIFQAVRDYRPVSVGIERGIAKQAVMSPLMDLMKRYGTFFRVEELTHGNKKKTDRVMWALQGRFENGYVALNKGEWNNRFLDQLFQFPDPLTHDDLVDALAYIDQLAQVAYHYDFEVDNHEVMDVVAGY
jgi:predicted phage terminase large subunit-like protein